MEPKVRRREPKVNRMKPTKMEPKVSTIKSIELCFKIETCTHPTHSKLSWSKK